MASISELKSTRREGKGREGKGHARTTERTKQNKNRNNTKQKSKQYKTKIERIQNKEQKTLISNRFVTICSKCAKLMYLAGCLCLFYNSLLNWACLCFSTGSVSTCNFLQFRCSNGNCISVFQKCNGVEDCPYSLGEQISSDEKDCGRSKLNKITINNKL